MSVAVIFTLAVLATSAHFGTSRHLSSSPQKGIGWDELEGFLSAAGHSRDVQAQLEPILNYKHDLPAEYLRKALVYRVIHFWISIAMQPSRKSRLSCFSSVTG
jgi:hypothetical protein